MKRLLTTLVLPILFPLVFIACGDETHDQSELTNTRTIGLKTLWEVDRSREGNRRQFIYCPLNATLPDGFVAVKLEGDCAILQGKQKSGVTALLAQEILPSDKELCMIRNSDMPVGWKAQQGPFGTRDCSTGDSKKFYIERI